LFENFVVYYPNSRFGMLLRKAYWGKKVPIGNNPHIYQGALIHSTSPELVKIGDDVIIGPSVVINIGPCKGFYIGSKTGIARGTFIRSANHRFDDTEKPYQEQGHDFKVINFKGREYSIVIEEDCWVGANAILLSGTHLGKGAIVSAGAVVSSVVPPYSIVVGNPARVIGNRLKGKK
jgi:acetyltransferase-like isoleucine patch superfamily enzyme